MVPRTAIITALLGTACATAPASPPRAVPTTASIAGGVSAGLAAAQAAAFSNHDTTADTEYAALLARAPRDPAVHAAYALFLNYRNDVGDARREAERAVALDAGDGAAAAVLCRVDDWSGRLVDAVSEGRTATRLAAEDPLAHLFLSEALADSGATAAAQAEIDAAGALIARHPTAYLLAERQREQANLDNDVGQAAPAVTAFKAAMAAQPGWLYRTAELVDAELADAQPAAARQALDQAAAQTPDDVETLETLGDDALFAADASAASALWSRALLLAPRDPNVLDANGEIEVAAKHDMNTAISDFERALSLDPRDLQAAAYLLALARYATHTPAVGFSEIAGGVLAALGGQAESRRIPSIPDPDAHVAADAATALAAVNSARVTAGLGAVRLDPRLSASAESHSFYWLFNNLDPGVAALGIHLETPGLTGYSARYPWTRASAFGYPTQSIGEDITHTGAPGSAVAQWVNSVFHRFAILRPDLQVIGYGEAGCGALLMEDMEFGFGHASPAAPVLYPAAGQTRVPAIFVDNELPDPVPAGDPRTTGYPVTVTFSVADTVTVSSFTLTSSSGEPLAAYVLTPSGSTENSASLLPAAPLTPGATYTARIAGTLDGRSYTRTWTFTVA